jgi:hypothetical protein
MAVGCWHGGWGMRLLSVRHCSCLSSDPFEEDSSSGAVHHDSSRASPACLPTCRREDGSIDTSAFKIIYVAPMKVRSGPFICCACMPVF